jgi:CBS domain-containing membrane protein
MAVLLGLMAWLDDRHAGILLVPPFAASLSILLNLSDVPIAQPVAMVAGSTLGATLGTVLALTLGGGPLVAALGAVAALVVLVALRIYHPPGVALAMYPALLHPGLWFPLAVVLPFTLAAVGSMALLSRVVPGWPPYPQRGPRT